MSILAEVETFLTDTGMTPYRFGKLAMSDTGLVFRVRKGRVLKPRTVAAIREFIAAERANPSQTYKRGPAAQPRACACGAPVSRIAKECRSCASNTARRKLQRPIPGDFSAVAPGRTINELQRIYSAGPDTVRRWRREVGLLTPKPVAPRTPRRDVPDGFRLIAPGMTMKQLRERFDAGDSLVRRWLAEEGVQCRAAGMSHWRQPGPRPLMDSRDSSRAGLAAQYLQRFGPVTRCDVDGRIDPKGTHWLRGGRFVLTDAEIMERATRQGWRPDAWRELSAA